MRSSRLLLLAVLGFAAPAPAQRFDFTRRMLPADNDLTTSVQLGDVDGDGDLDLYVGNSGQDRLYRNDGAGVYSDDTATSLPGLLDETLAVALGDVDGDGDLDAFVGNFDPPFGGQSRLLLNVGGGSFADVTGTNLPALLSWTTALALGDVDGDGDLDAFVGNAPGYFPPTAVQDGLYLNDGTGVFVDAAATNLPIQFDSTGAVALGDLDGDGDLDAFVGNLGQDRLYLNDGTGVFTDLTASNLPVLSDPTVAVVLGDVDGDGDLDAFVANNGTGAPPDRLHLNGGTGTFTDVTATNLPASWSNSRSAALGDVEGDGDLDILLGSWAWPGDRLLLNGGLGIFADAAAGSLPAVGPGNTRTVALGDADGDGDLDAFVGRYGQQNHLHLNSGAGAFGDTTGGGLPSALAFARALAVGDVDGDGDADAILGSEDVPPASLYLNDGTGTFTDSTPTIFPPTLFAIGAVALVDVDGDGDLDLLAGRPSVPAGLFLNSGAGAFTDVTTPNMPAVVDSTTSLAVGDVDGDGDLDAFLGNQFEPSGTPSGQDRLFLNGGAGVFVDATASNLPSVLDDTNAVALGDVDGDGDLDAFLGNGGAYYTYTGEQARLLLNGGTGVFADATATTLPPLLDDTTTCAFGDVDGDGDLDLYAGNYGWPDRLYLNGGAGTFADASGTNLPSAPDDTVAVALGDLDEDGDLDIFLAESGGYPGGQNRLLVNAGAGIFADATASDVPSLLDSTSAVALVDIDGDGDLDAFGAGYGQSRIYVNVTRQLSRRGVPRAGKPLALDVRGPGSGTWLLAASPGTSSLPLPPYGTLHLLPSTMFLVAGGPLDPQGRATLSFGVPANPALVGLSLYWQALVAPPLRLTNLEVTTVTGL